MAVSKTKRIVFFVVAGLIALIFIVGDVLAFGVYNQTLTTFFQGTGVDFDNENVAAAQIEGDNLVQRIMEEGIVLLKNENDALPLKESERTLNVMGWSSSDGGFLLKGHGSGSSTIRDEARVGLIEALNDAGLETNDALQELYTDNRTYSSYNLVEPGIGEYTSGLMTDARKHSSVAVVVLGRTGGENIGEIPKSQSGAGSNTSRTYLQTSTTEEALLTLAADNFDKVIVIINSANFIHMDFLAKDDRVDAALFVGLAGQSGTRAIADVLRGYKEVPVTDEDGNEVTGADGLVQTETVSVSPSGRVSDIITYEPTYDSTWLNSAPNGSHYIYAEDIYYGYKYYETADAEGFFDDVTTAYGSGYEGVVQFPFGYGQSYTTFEWGNVVSSVADGGVLTKDSEVKITLSVTNTGNTYAGREVVQLYSTPPYYEDGGIDGEGGIEKAHVNLVDFAKTDALEPGQKQDEIELFFSAYDLASYDAYNKSGLVPDGGYVLEEGEYELKLMNNSHEINACAGAVITFTVEDSIVFDKDPVTGNEVKNRWTGDTAYTGVPMDASKSRSTPVTYLSRADGFANRAAAVGVRPSNPTLLVSQANNFINDSFDQTEMPVFEEEFDHRIVRKAKFNEDGTMIAGTEEDCTEDELNGEPLPDGYRLYFNQKLIETLLEDYDDPTWDELLDQLAASEVKEFVERAGFRTRALESIGLPRLYDFDGPAGFNTQIQGTAGEWTAYTSQTVIGCTFSKEVALIFGLVQGLEAAATNIVGWYAPGVNLHRSPYAARNFEYYSEDGVLSGKLAAMTILGAKVNGLYCFTKHFVAHETGDNSRGLNVWMTEQNFRENYLKPFEIAVKEGKNNAIMTAFNRVGGSWAGANHALNNQVLREEWGFKGAVLTDWTEGGNAGSYGNVPQGLRGGNNIWLAPNGITSGPGVSTSNPTEMYLAKQSVKAVAYMYIDTISFQDTFEFEGELEKYKAIIGIRSIEPPFPLWIPLTIVGEILIALGIAAWGVFGVFKLHKRKAQTAGGGASGGDDSGYQASSDNASASDPPGTDNT